MIRTLDEYKKRSEIKRPGDHRPRLELLRQAAVRTEHLTGSPDFDSFLGYIQAAMEGTEGQKESLVELLSDPLVVDHARIMQAKIALAECKGRIDAWQAVIELPKDLIEAGDKAKGLLERMTKEEDNVAAK